MKRKLAAAWVVLLFCATVVPHICPGLANVGPAQPAADANAPLSLATYKSQLQQWSERVAALDRPEAAQRLRAELPPVLVVAGNDGHRIEWSTQWLDQALGAYVTKPDKRAEIIKDIQARLGAMQAQADAYGRRADSSRARGQLDDILARREFRAVDGPNVWEQLKAKLNEWLIRALTKLFSSVPTSEYAGQILVWLAIAVAACATALWLKRRASRAAVEIAQRQPILFAPSAKNWRSWLAEARAAAQAGDWRDAIHLAYWAGVSHLEASGEWMPDRARTPREYLRLLPAVSGKRSALTALTRKFEVVWYGEATAGADDFRDALTQLELLGCR